MPGRGRGADQQVRRGCGRLGTGDAWVGGQCFFFFCMGFHTHILDELADINKNQSSITIGGSEDGARDIRPISVQFHDDAWFMIGRLGGQTSQKSF